MKSLTSKLRNETYLKLKPLVTVTVRLLRPSFKRSIPFIFISLSHFRLITIIGSINSTVAVCGLPEPNRHHALVMCRFANFCRTQMKKVTSDLEATLGPGTADLSLRTGLHSGPTTAGVLRGEKARFQLFGDTVNTAARMESTSLPNKIQVSQATAASLIEHGKASWLQERADPVNAKGKGVLRTYFVNPTSRATSATISTAGTDDS